MNPEKKFDRAFLRAIAKKGLVINMGDEYYYMRFEKDTSFCKLCKLGVKCQKNGLMRFCTTMTVYAQNNTPMFKDVIFVKINPNIDLQKDNLVVYLKD